MRRYLLLTICLLPLGLTAQKSKYDSTRELRGSGLLVHELPAVKAFDTIEIRQFPGTVKVEVGATEAFVDITLDDNLQPFLRVENENGTLKLSFEDRQGQPFWISKANVDVKITTPTLKRLKHGSNSNIIVHGLQGNSFMLANEANGNVTLQGKVTTLDIVSSANGTVNADALAVESANIVTQANATVRVNARRVNMVRQAFANVINVADRTPTLVTMAVPKDLPKPVNVRFRNNSAFPRKITLISYAPGEAGNETNSFTLTAYSSREKQYPIGTVVYLATNRQVDQVMRGGRLRGKPFLAVSPEDNGRTVNIFK